MDILQSHDVSIAHCPKSNAKFGHGIAPVTKFVTRGFRVCLGTDSAASNNRLDLFEEARFALLQQRALEKHPVLSEQHLLEMMTIRGAESLGMQNQIGSLEKGKQADLIAVKMPDYYTRSSQVLYHLIHNTISSDVSRTIIAGKDVNIADVQEEIREFYRKL
jgi:cytosine/adenosine deaminase-related metal-dependent hydrolase